MGPDDVLPPDNPPAPPLVPSVPASASRADDANPTSVLCEFCECKITTSRGQVLDRSPKAHGYLQQDLTIRELRRDSNAFQKQAEDLRAKLTQLEGEKKAVVRLGL
jgi:hypothetical protein